MKAAVYHGPGDLRVEEVPVRKLKDNEVKIQEENIVESAEQISTFSTVTAGVVM